MLKIDAHQHFWKFDPVRDSWITEAMQAIRKDFLPQDLQPLLIAHKIDGCVAVQADQSEKDNEFLLSLADQYNFIRGVVGWVDLLAENVAERLEYYSQFPKMKGFRHVIQAEPDEDFMLRDNFKRGLAELEPFGYTYDILIYHNHLINAEKLVTAFPEQRFVIDHIAKPEIKAQRINDWANNIRRIAQHPHVFCKVSGMVTEADWDAWTQEDFRPYLDVIFEAFGVKRVMFGSDWPVCILAGGYNTMIDIVKDYTSRLSPDEQALFWGDNAAKFYQL